jgi:hypothetical protein
MTKAVRIENADNSSHKVLVQVFDKGPEGEPDILVNEHHLDQPTNLAEVYIHRGRYAVIKEKS